MPQLQFVPLIVLMAIAVLAWLVAAYSYFNMLVRAKHGWTRLVFGLGWWSPGKIAQYIEADGLPHYGRFIKALLWFMAAVVGAMVYVFIQVLLAG